MSAPRNHIAHALYNHRIARDAYILTGDPDDYAAASLNRGVAVYLMSYSGAGLIWDCARTQAIEAWPAFGCSRKDIEFFTLSNGRTIKATRQRNGSRLAIPTTGMPAMTYSEWDEYCALLSAR